MSSAFRLFTKLAQAQILFLTIFVSNSIFTNTAINVSAKSRESKATRFRRSELTARRIWPNATIPYIIDCSIANVPGAKRIIKSAMAEWERKTCIRFIKRTNQEGYLLIRRFRGCWSDVGYRRGQVTISMGDGCEFKFVMMHELGHIIGFYHEHNRPDRDDFIEIFWDNILNSMMKQFLKRKRFDEFDGELPYDYSSIMHYKFEAFSKNRSLETIGVKDKNSTERIAPYSYITQLDVKKTEEMYKCSTVAAKEKKSLVAKKKEDFAAKEKEDNLKKITPTEKPDSVVEVSLKSTSWNVRYPDDRIASIVVNGTEMAQNRRGFNIVLLNYLSGKVSVSLVYDITSKRGGLSFGRSIYSLPKRNYFLIVSKTYSFYYVFMEAKKALRSIGASIPKHVRSGSSFCLVGYKGDEDVHVKTVVGEPNEKSVSLSMNISLAEDYRCQDDIPRCAARARLGHCQKYPLYLLKVCQRSCKSCKVGRPCKDEHKYCKRWAKKKYCFKLPMANFMLKKCKVSCNVCRKALPAATEMQNVNTKRGVVGKDRPAAPRTYDDEQEDEEEPKSVGIRCIDKDITCSVWQEHGRCLTDSWVKQNCLISCNHTGVCDRDQIKPEGSCSEPFGLGWDRKLPDSAFNASSFLRAGNWNASASNARLYMEDDHDALRIGCWCAKDPPGKDWLSVDLRDVQNITAVATQGRFRYYEHVKNYQLSFSLDGKKWKYYTENRKVKTFKGNCDHMTPVLNILGRSVIARFVRFHPLRYYGGMCMRVEVYGCRLNYKT